MTKSQQRIIELLKDHSSIDEIAEKMCIQNKTVKWHLTLLFRHYGITGNGKMLKLYKRIYIDVKNDCPFCSGVLRQGSTQTAKDKINLALENLREAKNFL